MSTHERNAIRFLVVGLGQCGGNLANALAARGYPAMAFNAAAADMRQLEHIPAKSRHGISCGGNDGAGKDPDLGVANVRANATLIEERVKAALEPASVVLLCAGLGGGTGSAAPALASILKKLEVPVAALVTVPADHETGLSKINAVRAIDELIASDLDALFVVDNQRVFEALGDQGLDRFLQAGNERIVSMLDDLNTAHCVATGATVRGLDRMDLERAVLAGGFTRIADVEIPDTAMGDGSRIAARVAEGLAMGDFFAPGADLTQAKFAAVLVTGPKRVLGSLSPQLRTQIRAGLRERMAGAAVFAGFLEFDRECPVRVRAVAGGLGYPESAARLLAAAVTEGKHLSAKVNDAIGSLDLEGFDQFESALHRRTRSRSSSGSAIPAVRASAEPPARVATLVAAIAPVAPVAAIAVVAPVAAVAQSTPPGPSSGIAPRPWSATSRPAPVRSAEPAPEPEQEPHTERLSGAEPPPELAESGERRTPAFDVHAAWETVPRRAQVEQRPEPRRAPLGPYRAVPAAARPAPELRTAPTEQPKPRLEQRVRELITRGRAATTEALRRCVADDVLVLYSEPSVAGRMAALTVASLVDTERTRALLARALEDPSDEVRRKATFLLTASRNQRAAGGSRLR